MQEDANPKCKICHGEGEVYKYFANHKEKYVLFEWQYCSQCFPNSSGYWPNGDNIHEIDSNEKEEVQNQYKETQRQIGNMLSSLLSNPSIE